MKIELTPIGHVHTDADSIPRHWSISDVEGRLHIDEKYRTAIKDITAGDDIVVLFHFHKSEPFSETLLTQQPPTKNHKLGVFSICSPRRPNPIGLSIVKVLSVDDVVIHVKGIDMIDNTPIIDIKPNVRGSDSCPSCKED